MYNITRGKALQERRARPIPSIEPVGSGSNSKAHMLHGPSLPNAADLKPIELKPVEEETNELVEFVDPEAVEESKNKNKFTSEIERFIEISKYFSNPMRKTATYLCENRLVSFPNPYRIEYKRGGITTQHLKFSNLTLEPVYIKLYKLIPDLEQIKYINLSLSRCKRIPPGLSFTLGFVYDDVNDKPSCNANMVFVASKKTTTPCYQICEIDLQIEPLKARLNKL